jgi:membrane dipeptidase
MTTRRQTFQWMAGAVAALPLTSLAARKGMYDRSLVIDALCFGKGWGDEDFAGLKATGYSGKP